MIYHLLPLKSSFSLHECGEIRLSSLSANVERDEGEYFTFFLLHIKNPENFSIICYKETILTEKWGLSVSVFHNLLLEIGEKMGFQDVRFNYDQKKEEKPLIEKLPESEINEFVTSRIELEEKIKSKYGMPKFTGRLNLVKLREYLETIKKCQCEGIVEYKNKRNRETLNFAKFKNKSEPSGEEAMASISAEMNDKIKLAWVTRRFNLYDYPFQMEYREHEGKKCLALKKDFEYQNKYSATCWLIIRES